MWYVASLTLCEDDIQAGNQTDVTTVDLQVACLRKSLQPERDPLRTGPASVRLVNRAQRAYKQDLLL